MPYVSYKSAGGENRKADSTSIPDGTYTTCRFCSFDTVGSTSSARGRQRLNNGNDVATGSLLGGFDGKLEFTEGDPEKTRFAKVDEDVLYSIVDPGENVESLFSGTLDPLPPVFLGGAVPEFSATGTLTGFVSRGYAYMADGTGLTRVRATGDGPVTETWGLRSPGYHTFDEDRADPLTTTNADATVTVTVAGGHGLGAGIDADYPADYPFDMVIELVGLEAIGGAKSDDINCLHSGYNPSDDGNVTVTSSGGNIDPDQDGATYTIEWTNELGLQNMEKVLVLSPTNGAPLTGVTLLRNVAQQGDEDNNEQVEFTMSGTGGAGYFRLKVSDGNGQNGTTGDIAFDATADEWQAALEDIPWIGGGSQRATTVCSVISETDFTFELPDGAAITAAEGGGNIGFMRQGPTLTVEEGDGDLRTGRYYYAYTFYNGVAESNFSAQVPIEVSAGDAVTLTNVMLGPEGTTERRIYRTDVNTRQLYFIGRIEDNETTEFVDLSGRAPGADHDAIQGDAVTDQEAPSGDSDVIGGGRRASRRGVLEQQSTAKAASQKKREKLATNLGLLSSWTDHDPPPVTIRHVGVVGETAFGMDGADIVFSESGNVEHWPLSNRFTPDKNNAVSLVTWLPFDRDIIAYTSNSVHRFSALGLDYSDARLEEIESPVGCAGEFAAAALDGMQGHLVLTPAGLYLFDGSRMNEISYSVETLWTDPADDDYITPEFMSQACMVTSRDRMYLAYRSADYINDGPGPNNRILFGDFQDIQNPCFSVYEWEAGSLWREKSDNRILAGDSEGYLSELDVGYADVSDPIDWRVVTKEYALNDGAAFSLDEVVLDADFGGSTTTVVVATRARGNDKTATFTSSASGRQRIKHKLPTYLRGEVAKVTISSSGNSRRQLFACGFTYRPWDEP